MSTLIQKTNEENVKTTHILEEHSSENHWERVQI